MKELNWLQKWLFPWHVRDLEIDRLKMENLRLSLKVERSYQLLVAYKELHSQLRAADTAFNRFLMSLPAEGCEMRQPAPTRSTKLYNIKRKEQ